MLVLRCQRLHFQYHCKACLTLILCGSNIFLIPHSYSKKGTAKLVSSIDPAALSLAPHSNKS